LLILYCDGYLCFRTKIDDRQQKMKRFVQIVEKLPLELQMVVMRRVYLSSRTFFLSTHTEEALKRVLSIPFAA